MLKKLLPCALFLALSFYTSAQSDTLRVLFIGNSYTGSNALPTITKNLATNDGKTLIIDSHTPGGNILDQHANNPTALQKIRQGNWDFVVLQEQSQIPTIDFFRYNFMYPGARELHDTIQKYNPCARTTMYMTWGRRFGGQQCDQNMVNCSPDFVDFSHMQDSLESAYVEIGNELDAFIAPVGIAWKNVLEDTTIVLHTADNSHPNFTGSYLAACVFHAVFWDESPEGLSYTGSLSNDLAAYLQGVANQTVFQSTNDWNLQLDPVVADFSFVASGDSVQFTNLAQSPTPTTYLWDFGDGQTSTAENPLHVYTASQTYTVSLITINCLRSDTMTRDITVSIPTRVTADFSFTVFGDSVQFTNLSQSDATATYSWDFGDGQQSNDENPSHRYSSNQTFSVSLIAACCGQVDTVTKDVVINTTGILENEFRSAITVFPNPATTVVGITFTETFPAIKAELVNVHGEVLQSQQAHHPEELTFTLDVLPAGLYFLRVEDLQSQLSTFYKLVKP